MNPVYYIIVFLTLLVIEVGYVTIVRKFIPRAVKLRDDGKTKLKSVTGGGIIFFPAAIATIFSGAALPEGYWLLLAGGAIIWIVSLVDDYCDLSPYLRLFIQLIVTIMAVLPLTHIYAVPLLVLAIFCFIAFMNAYNFMDGVNGMLPMYTLVVLSSILAAGNSLPMITQLSVSLLIATAILFYFNVIRYDEVFSGDVGSIIIGYFIAYMLIFMIVSGTPGISCIVFVMVYIIDTSLTLLNRIRKRENIFNPHKQHLYQQLIIKRHINQTCVALIFSSTQLIINGIYFIIPENIRTYYTIGIAILLTITYLILKRWLCRQED